MTAERSRLDGRTALVTGGAGFLGRQWTAALLGAGADVVTVDVTPFDDRPEGVRHQHVDITDQDAVMALAAQLAVDNVEIDVLVNNAAHNPAVSTSGLEASARLETFSLARWNDDVAVGLTGAFLCAQAFGPSMAARGRGSIVNISSDLGLVAPDQRLYRVDGVAESDQPVKPVSYSVVKTGLVGLTRYLATYWADRGVRANALCLGGVQRDQPPEFLEEVAQRIPLGRMALADEYREAMVFLCSDASSYMTGSCLVIDGGRTTW